MKIRMTAVLIFVAVIGIAGYSAEKSNKNQQEKTSVVLQGRQRKNV